MWEVVGKALAKIISPAGLDNRPYWHLSCGLSYRHSLPTNAWRMWHRSCNHSRVWCVGVCIWWNAHRALGAWASWNRSFGRHVVSIPRQYWGLQYFSLKFQNPSPTKPPPPPPPPPTRGPLPTQKKKKNEKKVTHCLSMWRANKSERWKGFRQSVTQHWKRGSVLWLASWRLRTTFMISIQSKQFSPPCGWFPHLRCSALVKI